MEGETERERWRVRERKSERWREREKKREMETERHGERVSRGGGACSDQSELLLLNRAGARVSRVCVSVYVGARRRRGGGFGGGVSVVTHSTAGEKGASPHGPWRARDRVDPQGWRSENKWMDSDNEMHL